MVATRHGLVPESASRNARLEAERADVAEAGKNLATKVASDHEDCVNASAKERRRGEMLRRCFNRKRVELRDRRIHCFGRVHPLDQRHRHIPHYPK